VLPRNADNFALLAEGPLDQIRRLREEIDAYTGVRAAEECDADVWLRLQGNDLTWPDAPTSVVTAFLDAFRKGVQVVAEFMATGQLTTRPTSDLKRACDLRVVGFETGSLKIGMRLPEPDEEALPASDAEAPLAERALSEYLQVASWVAAEQEAPTLEVSIPDAQRRRILLNALKPLVPRPRGEVESLEISGRLVPARRPIRLTRETNERTTRAIDRTAAAEETRTYTGDLREFDLDNRSFILRNAGDVEEIRCNFG